MAEFLAQTSVGALHPSVRKTLALLRAEACRGPPTSPSTATRAKSRKKKTRIHPEAQRHITPATATTSRHPTTSNDTYSAFVALASGVFARWAAAGAAAGAGAPTGASNDDRRLVDRRFRLVDRRRRFG